MADSNLNSSISALVSDLQNQIATATVTELLLITRAAKAIGHTENTAIEIAVNTRVNQLTSTATADELEKLARAVDNLTDTASAATVTTSISDHTDVDTTTTPPTDGQALIWENSTALWKPEDVSSDSYTDILPDTTATYDLGSPSKTWVDVYASNIKGLDAPINDTDSARKKYVDDLFASAVVTVNSVNGYQGSVLLTTDDVDEGIYNLYYDDTKVDSHLNQTSATNNQILSWNGTDYAWVENSSFSTATVTTSGGKYYIDGEQQVILTLQPGRTYRFDQSDASNTSHPLKFSEVSDGTHAGGGATEYTTGVTVNGTAGSASAYVEIVVTNATPRLHYYCANHSGMGGKVGVGKEMFVERITSDTWITGPIQTTTVNVATGGSISAQLATLDFTNTTVNFSGASITGLSNSDVDLANIADNAQGVVVTGKVAAGSLDLAIGGSINGQLTTLDFRDTTVNFSGANISGLDDTVQDEVDFHLNKNNAGGSTIISDGKVLSWNATGGIQGTGDYEWIDTSGSTAGALGTLTKTFTQNEEAEITLLETISPVPNVSVFKEVPQGASTSKGNWDVNANATNYDFFDEKPISYASSTLTPSATGDGTFSTAFNASDVGKKVVGNSGSAIITGTSGTYTSVTAFADTSAISSWQLFGAQGKSDGSGIQLSGFQNGYDIANASYDNVSFSLQAQDSGSAPQNTYTGPNSLRFNNDGTKMYFVAGNSLDHIFEYDLSTAWDLSSASYNNSNLVVTSQTTSPTGIEFSSDGTKLFLADQDQDKIWKYNLSTAWDLSSASYSNNQTPGDILRNLDAKPGGLVINSDGTRILWLGKSNERVYQMTLSTAYDLSTASMDTKLNGTTAYVDISALGTAMTDINISSDGKKLFLVNGYGTTGIYQYDLANPYEINDGSTNSNQGTASYNNISFSFPQDGRPSSVAFDTLGTKMYAVGMDNDTVYQYSTGEAATPYSQYFPALTTTGGQINSSSWIDLDSMVADETKNDGDVFYAVSTDDRTSWGVIKDGDGVRKIARNNSGTWQYNNDAGTTVTVGYDLANGSYVTMSAELSQTEGYQYMYFKPDGTKVWVGGFVQDTIYEYDLGTAWDLSTISYGRSKAFSTSSQSVGFFFKPDGTRAYIAHSNGPVYQLNMNTPWNISTAQTSYGTYNTSNTSNGIFFKSDGTKFYKIDGSTGRELKQFSMTTAWDVTTASVDHTVTIPTNQGVTSGGTAISGNDIWFSSDGTNFFFPHWNGGNNSSIPKGVAKFSLSTAWDISSTITYVENIKQADGGGTILNWLPTAVNFKPDGSKMYMITGENTSTSPARRIFEFSTGGTNIVYDTSETWVDGTNNNEHATLQEALGAQSFNRMAKAQLQAVTDPNHYVLGDTLDLMIAPYAASGSSPISDGVTIGYQAAALIEQAINGTDYKAEFPATNKVKIKSLAAQNLKIRII